MIMLDYTNLNIIIVFIILFCNLGNTQDSLMFAEKKIDHPSRIWLLKRFWVFLKIKTSNNTIAFHTNFRLRSFKSQDLPSRVTRSGYWTISSATRINSLASHVTIELQFQEGSCLQLLFTIFKKGSCKALPIISFYIYINALHNLN